MADEYEDHNEEYNGPESSYNEPEPDDEPTPYSPSGKPKSYWDSDEALKNLTMEKELNPHESNTQLTKRLFEENAPQAAMTLIHLAQHATNENTRLNAAKYVTERVLGKLGDGSVEEGTPLDQLMNDLTRQVENHANNG